MRNVDAADLDATQTAKQQGGVTLYAQALLPAPLSGLQPFVTGVWAAIRAREAAATVLGTAKTRTPVHCLRAQVNTRLECVYELRASWNAMQPSIGASETRRRRG